MRWLQNLTKPLLQTSQMQHFIILFEYWLSFIVITAHSLSTLLLSQVC